MLIRRLDIRRRGILLLVLIRRRDILRLTLLNTLNLLLNSKVAVLVAWKAVWLRCAVAACLTPAFEENQFVMWLCLSDFSPKEKKIKMNKIFGTVLDLSMIWAFVVKLF
uniref:Uncharacterized protein n=1 Tax=Cucumis melo TaxID=3656 RepID=A0A9I9DGF5_CUCME